MIDIKLCKSSHEKVVAMNGVREVLLRTDEIRKQKIPHLVNFQSGQSILITMQGRPPFCLKCRELGHVRRNCPNNRSFARVATQEMEEGVAPGGGPTGPVTPVPSGETASGSVLADPEAVPPPADVGADGAGDRGTASDDQQTTENDIDMSQASSKRERDEGDDDFITPNRPARRKTLPQSTVPTKNTFSIIMGIDDLMKGEDD